MAATEASTDKQVYLYVGPHRSGSTFLITHIFSNLPNLCDMRTHDRACCDAVLDAMCDHPMFIDVAAYRERIYRKFDAIEEDNVIIAEEEFFGDYGKYISDGIYVAKPFYDSQHRIETLAKLFDNPKIILSPRRQDLWIESAYMHFIHNFHTIKFEDFICPGLFRGDRYTYTSFSNQPAVDFKALDWSRYLQDYYDAFGEENVLVMPQEMVLHHQGTALKRLYEFMGIDAPIREAHHTPNKSLSDKMLKISLLLNRFVNGPNSRIGFLPIHPFGNLVGLLTRIGHPKLAWFVAGINRRISLHWLLTEIGARLKYKRPNLCSLEFRQKVLTHFDGPNRKYAKIIGVDLSVYGYYDDSAKSEPL